MYKVYLKFILSVNLSPLLVFRNNPLRLNEKITKKLYRYPALSPSNNCIVAMIPQSPSDTRLEVLKGSIQLSWKKESNTKEFVIYKLRKGRTADLNEPENILAVSSDTTVSFTLNRSTGYERYNYYITPEYPKRNCHPERSEGSPSHIYWVCFEIVYFRALMCPCSPMQRC